MRADLGAVREAATLLAAQEREPTFAADAAPSLQDIRDAAATVRDASSLTAASAAAGALGAVCGECHARTGADPSFAEVLKPKEDETLLGHMARHAWAVNRLWEALVKGDAALWTRGLNELAEPPLDPDILGTSPPRRRGRIQRPGARVRGAPLCGGCGPWRAAASVASATECRHTIG